MDTDRLRVLQNSYWSGNGELWLDPAGNEAYLYDCTLQLSPQSIDYEWVYEGVTKRGAFTFSGERPTWVDSWHQPTITQCTRIDAWGLFTLHNTYDVPSNPAWGWRSKLSERPTGELVLQMTNITPWGEEGRAVRMIFSRKTIS